MFSRIAFRFRGWIATYLAMGWTAALCGALSVLFFQRLVDALGGGAASLQAAAGPLAWYAALSGCCIVLYYLEEIPCNRLRLGIEQFIRQSALRKVSAIDYTAYQAYGTGQLVKLVENGAAAGRDIVYEFHLRIAGSLLPSALFSLVFMGAYSPFIMLVAASGYVVVFIVTRLLLKRLHAIKERTLVDEEWLSKTFVRALMELVVLRVNRRFRREIERVRRAGDELVRAHTRIKLTHEFFFAAFALIVLAIKVAMVAVCVPRLARGELSIGVLLALLTLTDRIYEPIAIFNVIYVDYKLDRVAWARLEAFDALPDDPNLRGDAAGESGSRRSRAATDREAKPLQAYRPGSAAIAFDGVAFDYGGAPILRDLNLAIEPGRTTAIVGRSGAGKSTIAKLLLGLVKPTGGRITVDGQDLSALDLLTYYAHVAYISQDAPVIDGTLRENLSFDADVSDEALWQALDRARLGDFVRALPGGFETQVGERGVKLSGGEKQRLALARALLQDPLLLVLDEPTSALDVRTEREVVEALNDALRGRTVVSIAHRLSTVRDADAIVVLEDGAVAERGTHAELLRRDGAYARLVAADRGGEAAAGGDGEAG